MYSPTLTAIRTNVFEHKKLFLTAMFFGLLSSNIFITTTNAAKIVYDPKNTAEAVKILQEAQNITNVVGKQLGLSEQDLKNINAAVDKYTKLINQHSKNLDIILNQRGGYVAALKAIGEETGNGNFNTAEKWLGALIPAVTDENGNISFKAKNIARLAAAGAIMTNNKDMLEAMKQIQIELNNSEQVLQELLKQNGELGLDNGTLAAQQLNNQIKGVETHIANLQAQMEALNNQSKILQSQAEAQDKQNEIVTAQAHADANDRYIKENSKEYDTNEEIVIQKPWH